LRASSRERGLIEIDELFTVEDDDGMNFNKPENSKIIIY
jgi:hypothetical protein